MDKKEICRILGVPYKPETENGPKCCAKPMRALPSNKYTASRKLEIGDTYVEKIRVGVSAPQFPLPKDSTLFVCHVCGKHIVLSN